MAPLRRGGLHQRHDVGSVLVGAEQNPTQEAEADSYTDPARKREETTAFAGAIEDEGVSPPTLPCRHQHCLVFAIMRLIKWRGRLWWTILTASAVSGLMVVEPEKAREGAVHADTTEARRQCHPIWLVPTPALGKQASGTEAQRQRQRSMSNRAAEYEERVQLHTALQSAVYCKLALALAKIQTTLGQRKVS